MDSISLNPLTPEEDTVEWHSKLLTDKGMLLIDIPMEQEIIVNQTQAMESENFVTDDPFENGQRITTQDLTVPELSSMDCTPPPPATAAAAALTKKTRKRHRSEPCLNELNKIREEKYTCDHYTL